MTDHERENEPPDWELIERVLAGDPSASDREAFDRWAAVATPKLGFGAQDALKQAHERLGITVPPPSRRWPHRSHATWRFAALAGVGAIAIVASTWWLPAIKGWRDRSTAGLSNGIEQFATPLGARTSLVLRDGTHVVLGPGTHLRVLADFGHPSRTVELDGKGYFTVVHDALHPFTVRTARSEIHDVGTQFAVDAYAGDAREWVAVADGEVRIDHTSLAPSMVGTIDSTGILSVRRSVDLAPYLGWVQGRLAFDGTPLRDVVRELSRTFDTSITVADTVLSTYQVSGSFDRESLTAILDEITDAMGAHYERGAHGVVIRRGRSRVSHPSARHPSVLTTTQLTPLPPTSSTP